MEMFFVLSGPPTSPGGTGRLMEAVEPPSLGIAIPTSASAACAGRTARAGAGAAATPWPTGVGGAIFAAGALLVGASSCTMLFDGVDFHVPGNGLTGTPSWAATMNSCQASAGSEPPVTRFIGLPSSLPNQTPVVRLAVLPAEGQAKAALRAVPVSTVPAIIEFIMPTTSGLTTRGAPPLLF